MKLSQRFQLSFGGSEEIEGHGQEFSFKSEVTGREKISERRRTVRMIECNLQTSSEDPQGHLAADGVTVHNCAR